MKRRPLTKNHQIENYVKRHFSIYIFTIVLFVMGIVFGSLVIHTLSITQKQEMISYLSHFFHGMSSNSSDWLENDHALKQVVFDNLKYLGAIWFLGLSIIGMPLIFLLIFMKGFVVGFTITFLISQLQWKGFLFSIVSVLPQNLLIVPTFIVAGVAGIVFSVSLIKSRMNQQHNNTANYPSLSSYSFLMVFLGVILLFASGFEAYISPYLMKTVATFLVN